MCEGTLVLWLLLCDGIHLSACWEGRAFLEVISIFGKHKRYRTYLAKVLLLSENIVQSDGARFGRT